MRREEQHKINEMVLKKYDESMVEFEKWQTKNPYCARLRTYNAWVIETSNYYFLQSNDIILALIDKRDDVLYDVSRLVWRYTSIRPHVISTFAKYYSRIYLNGTVKYTWKVVYNHGRNKTNV